MVVINLKGGLGNQLFEFAAAYSIARARGQELYFDVSEFENDRYMRKPGLQNFNITFNTLGAAEVKSILKVSATQRLVGKLKTRCSKRYFSLKNLENEFSILQAKPKVQYLNGYFANENYFKQNRSELLELIDLKAELKTKKYLDTVSWIAANNFTSIHVRRADYISDSAASQLFESLNLDYYERAISEVLKSDANAKFVVFSDDLSWCKETFKGEKFHFISEQDLYTDFYDLMLMSKCANNIIANSTFSWWAAWLNKNDEKKVIAPTQWYRNSAFQKFAKESRFIPLEWERL